MAADDSKAFMPLSNVKGIPNRDKVPRRKRVREPCRRTQYEVCTTNPANDNKDKR